MPPLWRILAGQPVDPRSLWGRDPGPLPPVDVHQIAQGLGITLWEMRASAKATDCREIDGDAARVYVRAGDPEPQRRYAIATHIGAILGQPDPAEWAGRLLIPQRALEAAIAAAGFGPDPVDRIADWFEVPPDALALRLRRLHRIR